MLPATRACRSPPSSDREPPAALRRLPLHVQGPHHRTGGTGAKRRDEPVHGLPIALGRRLDASVGEVAHEPSHAVTPAGALGEEPEAHALHIAADPEVRADRLRTHLQPGPRADAGAGARRARHSRTGPTRRSRTAWRAPRPR